MFNDIILSLGIITGFFIAGVIPYCLCTFAIQAARRWRAISSILRVIDTAREDHCYPLDGEDDVWDVISEIEDIAGSER